MQRERLERNYHSHLINSPITVVQCRIQGKAFTTRVEPMSPPADLLVEVSGTAPESTTAISLPV